MVFEHGFHRHAKRLHLILGQVTLGVGGRQAGRGQQLVAVADGQIEATVVCVVDLESASGIGFPASRTLTSSFTAPVDRYRGVTS